MLRGINRQDIFDNPEDYAAFISILAAVQNRLGDDRVHNTRPCHIYAYCLMPNHVHILVGEKQWTVGEVMKSIAAAYALYYNKKYGRIGHLFQDRFKSEPCNDSSYFVTLFRYIHQNPVKAGLVNSARDYPYSSWRNDYLGLAKQKVCHTQSPITRYGIEALKAWVDSSLDDGIGCIDMKNQKIIADETVRQLMLQESGTRTIAAFQLLDRKKQKEIVQHVMDQLHAGPRQMSRVSGLPYSTIYKG